MSCIDDDAIWRISQRRKTTYVAAVMGTGIRRAIDAVGTSSRCWILVAAASTLDTTLTAGVRDNGRRQCHGDLQ
jgi:hypothetical protein